MASTYLTRTPGSAGNLTTWTFSGWFKRLSMGNTTILGCAIDGQNQDLIYFQSDGTLRWWRYGSNDYVGQLKTTRVFKDPSAWYHIVFVWDSSNATADNRMRIYVNGTQETVFTTRLNPPLNTTSLVNTADALAIGRAEADIGTYPYFDGSMAHVHFIDGTAYAASTFGETDSTTGQWKPKTTPSVTYGTNGFFLKFANSGSMGTDSSGNGNNFTVNGTLTQTQDTPSNVFCCLNPLKKHSGQTLSYLNLRNVGAGSANIVGSTFAPSQGKWYFEFKLVSANAYAVFLYPQNLYQVGDDLFGSNYTTGFYSTTPSLYQNGSNTGSLGGGVANNDIIQVAMDLDSNNIYFGKNGNWNDGLGGGFDQSDFSNATGHTLTRNSSFDEIGIATLNGGSGSSYTLDWNFGDGYFGTTAVSSSNADGAGYGLFEYAPPTGYYSLCTKNINTYG
jgi:hypothetical protein